MFYLFYSEEDLRDYQDELMGDGFSNDAQRTVAAFREIEGAHHADRKWILSPYDTWEVNPYYDGPDQPHPECDDPEAWYAASEEEVVEGEPVADPWADVPDDDLPF